MARAACGVSPRSAKAQTKGEALFGELAVAYLFLAGVGAGGIAAASLADLFFVRAPFGEEATVSVAEAAPAERLAAFVFAVSMGALALGVACLLLDLGRIDRVTSLFLSAKLTLMNVGAWSLATLLAVGAALTLVRFMYLPAMGRTVVTVLEVAAVVLAAVVAVYAGLLLQTLPGVRLWESPCVPVLFVLSAASCGCALVCGASLFAECDEAVVALARVVASVDLVVVLAEAVAAALFLGFAASSGHPGVQASAENLLHGSAALGWWVGFVLCGLIVPLACECVLWARWRNHQESARATPVAAIAVVAAFVLVGGVSLRWSVVEAGEHRPLELQAVAATGSDAERASDVPAEAFAPSSPPILSAHSIQGGLPLC